jgi:hypothetical protein
MLVVLVTIEAGQLLVAARPRRARGPKDASCRTDRWLAVEGPCRNDPGGTTAGEMGKRGAAGGTEAGREALSTGNVVTLDTRFTREPLEVAGIRQEICRVAASSRSSTARAVAMNKEQPGALGPVANTAAETATLDRLIIRHMARCLTI